MLFSWCRIEVDGYIVEGEAAIQNNSASPRADWARMDLQVYPKIKEDLASRFVGGHPSSILTAFLAMVPKKTPCYSSTSDEQEMKRETPRPRRRRATTTARR